MEEIHFLTILGVVIAMAFLSWLTLHMEDFGSDDSRNDTIRVVRQSQRRPTAKKPPQTASPRIQAFGTTAQFQMHQEEGEICWRTGNRKDCCPCESCKK